MGRTAVRNETGHDGGAWLRGARAAAAIVAVVGAVAALALGARPAAAQITAEFTTPIGITVQQDLLFGALIPEGSFPGSVTIASGGGRTGSNVTLVSSIFQQAVFKVTGDALALFDITLPTDNTIELTSGANTMTIATFTSSPSGSGQILFTGFSFVSVGATLAIAANQPAGTYTGTFDVTVDYQPIP